MTSTSIILLGFALMMAAFKGCECNDGAYSPGYENRQILSMIQDGAPVLVRATRHSLNSSGIGDEQTIRVVESLLKIYTFRHEKVDMITLSNPSGLGHSVGVIIDAILEDACNWLKSEGIIERASNCNIEQTRRLLALIEINAASISLDDELIRNQDSNGRCTCWWAKDHILNNMCSNDQTFHILDQIMDHCNLCTDQEAIIPQTCFLGH